MRFLLLLCFLRAISKVSLHLAKVASCRVTALLISICSSSRNLSKMLAYSDIGMKGINSVAIHSKEVLSPPRAVRKSHARTSAACNGGKPASFLNEGYEGKIFASSTSSSFTELLNRSLITGYHKATRGPNIRCSSKTTSTCCSPYMSRTSQQIPERIE